MGQSTSTTFAGTVFSFLQIYSTNYFFEGVWFRVSLNNAHDDSAKKFIFRLAENLAQKTISATPAMPCIFVNGLSVTE